MAERSTLGAATWPYDTLAATHTHVSNGTYRATGTEPGDGQWLLVVSKAGCSPVVQRLTLETKQGMLRAKPGWKEAGTDLQKTAALVSIVNYQQAPGAAAAQYALVTVQLVARTELLSLASHNHLDGTNYALFCEGRRNKLYWQGVANKGTIFTLLVADPREQLTMVKSGDPSVKSWVTVGKSTKAPVVAGEARPTIGSEWGILDLYGLMNDRGRRFAGTVLEVDIYGHAYHEGPIIWNTWDNAPSRTDRDPNDLDGRQKDWWPTGPTMTALPDLPACFQGTAAFRSFGCTHMVNVIAEGNAGNQHIRAGTARNRFFRVRLSNGVENATLDYLKRSLAQFFVSQKIRHMQEAGDASGIVAYGGMAAQLLRRATWAAPPGMGSLYRQVKEYGWEGYISPTGENTGLMAYYRAEFGAHFVQDDLGYVDYNSMLAAPLPDPGWSTERWIRYRDDDIGQTVLRLPSGTELFRTRGTYADPVAHTSGGVNGHLYPALLTHPDHVEERANDRVLVLAQDRAVHTGVFVGTDGRALLMRRQGNGPWALNTDPIPVVRMQFAGGPNWTPDPAARPPLSAGVLEAVTPRWYW